MSSTTANMKTPEVIRKRGNKDKMILAIIGYVTLTVLAIFCIFPSFWSCPPL